MDFRNVNRKALISDLVKVATFQIVAHVLMSLRFNEPLFNEKYVEKEWYFMFERKFGRFSCRFTAINAILKDGVSLHYILRQNCWYPTSYRIESLHLL